METIHRFKIKEHDWRVQATCDEDIMPSTEQILGSEYHFLHLLNFNSDILIH